MEITGKITGIEYKPLMTPQTLPALAFEKFCINDAPSACLLNIHRQVFGLSKWVSPKRTRTYPYGRVYDTLNRGKVVTVIPVVKDEGALGDRDFLQWDTIALLSLLDVFVIIAYYDAAVARHSASGKLKITGQRFCSSFVNEKLTRISNYRCSALHWNLGELAGISDLLTKARDAYHRIATKTKVVLHNFDEYDRRIDLFREDVSEFMRFSRLHALNAQQRESVTLQPKEHLATDSKAKITIGNYLGGLYHFTVDEVRRTAKELLLIESKHSQRAKLPSVGDIKDGLIKMMLFSNLVETQVDGVAAQCRAVLQLTSSHLAGAVSSLSTDTAIKTFFRNNAFTPTQQHRVSLLFQEARANRFEVRLEGRS